MDLAKAAELARDCVHEAGLPGELFHDLATCADIDIRQAKELVAYASCDDEFGVRVMEGTLYSLIAHTYLRRLPFSTFAEFAHLSERQLRCLRSFQIRPTSLQSRNDNDDVSELIESLWKDYCSSQGFQVSPAVRLREVGAKYAINIPPLGPCRAPTSSLLLEDLGSHSTSASKRRAKRARVEAHTGEKTTRGKAKADASSPTIPKFFDIIAVVTESKEFTSLPSSCEDCKLLERIGDRITVDPSLLALRERVKDAYKNVQHDRDAWCLVGEDYPLVPLTVSEARRLLLALESSSLLYHLVVERHGHLDYLMSHEMIVTDGTERARLFLARMDLPVHCHLPLTYAQLCTEECRPDLEEQACAEHSSRRPSGIDKSLRQNTLDCMWRAEAPSILSLRPEDYARGGATQSSEAWQVVQKLRYPLPADEYFCVNSVGFWLSSRLDKIIDKEAQHVQEWLYSGGKPDGTLFDGIRFSECVVRAVEERVSGRI